MDARFAVHREDFLAWIGVTTEGARMMLYLTKPKYFTKTVTTAANNISKAWETVQDAKDKPPYSSLYRQFQQDVVQLDEMREAKTFQKMKKLRLMWNY